MKNQKKIKHIKIFDIDGVLLDSSHRYRTIVDKKGERIDLDHWREHEPKCIYDTTLPLADLYKCFLGRQNTFVIIATSRVLKALDYSVISEKLGEPDGYISRLHNGQKGGNLKLQGIKWLINECNLVHVLPENITVYEDNIKYLKTLCDGLNCQGIYVPSKQGH